MGEVVMILAFSTTLILYFKWRKQRKHFAGNLLINFIANLIPVLGLIVFACFYNSRTQDQ